MVWFLSTNFLYDVLWKNLPSEVGSFYIWGNWNSGDFFPSTTWFSIMDNNWNSGHSSHWLWARVPIQCYVLFCQLQQSAVPRNKPRWLTYITHFFYWVWSLSLSLTGGLLEMQMPVLDFGFLAVTMSSIKGHLILFIWAVLILFKQQNLCSLTSVTQHFIRSKLDEV